MRPARLQIAAVSLTTLLTWPALAATIFNSGSPDGAMAMGSRPSSAGKIEIEAGDDFILPTETVITGGTFTGLIAGGATTANIGAVDVEVYRVFPLDSTSPPSGNVPTRNNSPSDIAFDSRTAGTNMTFSTSVLNSLFSASNSVLNGINKIPSQQTAGEGAVRGEEVQFNFTFTTPLDLPANHYFFIPQVEITLANGEFYWLSAAKPITGAGTTPFSPDLQAWIRNQNLDPDWLRVGTDIVGGNPAPTFNAAFSLQGTAIPEPATVLLVMGGIGLAGLRRLRR